MKPQEIHDHFTVFYEGFFESFSRHGRDINFKVECSYLADLLYPGGKYFYGTLKNAENFYFVPWDDEMMVIRDLKRISSFRLDILGVELTEDGFIKIFSNCEHTWSGGNLFIEARSVKIYDELFERKPYEDLVELADQYWYCTSGVKGF